MPIPLIPLITAGISAYSAIRNAKKAKDAENEAEGAISNAPKYTQNSSILGYYNEALRRYNTNPSDTREYKLASQNIKQGTVQGLKALQDRRSGLAGVPTLVANQNNSLLRAAVNAENRKAQEFNVLGNATGMKAGEDKAAFQQNQMYPFEAKYNLLSMKAAGARANQRQNTSNLYNNLSAAAGLIDTQDPVTKPLTVNTAGTTTNTAPKTNLFGQPMQTFMGKTYTENKMNRLNNAWMKDWNTGMSKTTAW